MKVTGCYTLSCKIFFWGRGSSIRYPFVASSCLWRNTLCSSIQHYLTNLTINDCCAFSYHSLLRLGWRGVRGAVLYLCLNHYPIGTRSDFCFRYVQNRRRAFVFPHPWALACCTTIYAETLGKKFIAKRYKPSCFALRFAG